MSSRTRSERDSLLQGEHLLLLVLVVVHLRTVGELIVPRLEHKGGTEATLESQSHADASKQQHVSLPHMPRLKSAESPRRGLPLNLGAEDGQLAI